uniref:Uncharacterized protein n=1 Tax=Arundo donax TaxID=35708 RepID=A0A0A9GII4_ARUDO
MMLLQCKWYCRCEHKTCHVLKSKRKYSKRHTNVQKVFFLPVTLQLPMGDCKETKTGGKELFGV